MRDIDVSTIRSMHLFAEMADGRIEDLIEGASVERYAGRTCLIEEGASADSLHLLLEGCAELFTRLDQRETTIMLLRPVAAFTLPAVIADLPYLASVRTLGPASILTIEAQAVRSAFAADPKFACAVALELSRPFRDLLTEVKNLKARTGIQRLADWLCRTHAETDGAGPFSLPCDKRTLASLLGMTPENLSRSLKALSGRGLITNGRDVVVNDPPGLARMARGGSAGDEAEW